ncbi:hypothetical protein DFH07DRAFT_986080 [Mycena maculata]|uniref:Uncharacterized protein n=1 Tax=Mycena maculata TaxID=230809 RepID=A0AAD7I747_9AGAR|nr:hypothetical protein DFH07DRAFT_986080 [Mycena maculata]
MSAPPQESRGRGRPPKRRKKPAVPNTEPADTTPLVPLTSAIAATIVPEPPDPSQGIPLTGPAAREALLAAQGATPALPATTSGARLFLNTIPHEEKDGWKLVKKMFVDELAPWFDDILNDFNPYELLPDQKLPSASCAVQIRWIGHPGDSPRDPRARRCFIRWNEPRPSKQATDAAIVGRRPVLRWDLRCAGVHNLDFSSEAEETVEKKGAPLQAEKVITEDEGRDEDMEKPEDAGDTPGEDAGELEKPGRWKECSTFVKLHVEVYPDDLSMVSVWQQHTHPDVALEDRVKGLKFSRLQRSSFIETLGWTGFPQVEDFPEPTSSELFPKSQAKYLLKALSEWPTMLEKLDQQLKDLEAVSVAEPAVLSVDPSPPESSPTESTLSLIGLAKIKGGASLTFSHLQAMATGLLCVLELGTTISPVTNAGLALDPKKKIADHYTNLPPFAVNELQGLKIEQVLRPLAFALNFSPLLAFASEKDLLRMHLPVKTLQEMRLLLSGRNHTTGHAQRYMEEAMYELIRTTCMATSIEEVMKTMYKTLRISLPKVSQADTDIFTARKPVAQPIPVQPYRNPPQIQHTYTARGPLTQGFTLAVLKPDPMTLFSDLDISAQREAVPVQFTSLEICAHRREIWSQVWKFSRKELSHSDGKSLDVAESTPSARDKPDTFPDLALPAEGGDTHRSPSPENEQKKLEVDLIKRYSLRAKPPPTPAKITGSGSNSTKRKLSTATGGIRKKNRKAASNKALQDHLPNEGDRGSEDVSPETEPESEVEEINEPRNLADVEEDLERCRESMKLGCYLPDGLTWRELHYVGHENSKAVEYKLLYDVKSSMDSVTRRCAKQGIPFQHVPFPAPMHACSHDEFQLCHFTLSERQDMTALEHGQLLGSGHDIYVEGMTFRDWNKDNTANKLRRLHRSDAVVEVQVQGLRVRSSNEDTDYSESIRTTTLERVLDNAERSDGLVLNVLKLPSGHTVHSNPLLESGLDLEDIAYRQTNNLPGFKLRYPPYSELYWQLFGTLNTLSIPHLDVASTRVNVEGPGEKFWIRGRRRDTTQMVEAGVDPRIFDLGDSFAFSTWQPDEANLDGLEWEGVVLPAGHGTLIMGVGRPHLVIGAPPFPPQEKERTLCGTLTTGGHFFCASTMYDGTCMILHLVMSQHLLTNADHVGIWEVFVRIGVFWLHATRRSPQQQEILASYLPDITGSKAPGWVTIIFLASVIVLLPAVDLRHYQGEDLKPHESQERLATQDMYRDWRAWFAGQYTCMKGGEEVNLENDVFSPILVHLALVLVDCHRRQVNDTPGADIFSYFTITAFLRQIRSALGLYDAAVLQTFNRALSKKEKRSTQFLLFPAGILEFRGRSREN